VRRVGLDLGVKADHVAQVVEDGRPWGRPLAVTHDREGFERLLARGTAGAEGPVEFVLEPTGNAWQVPAAWLRQRGQRVILTTGQKVADLRKVLRKHTKTDVVDGLAAARVPELELSATVPAAPPDPRRASLARLIKQRARMVREIAKHKQRIEALLELGQPGLEQALGASLFGPAGRAYLRRFLDPFQARRRGRRRLQRFFEQRSPGDWSKRVERVWAVVQEVCDFYAELVQAGQLPFDYVLLQQELNLELDGLEWLMQQVAQLEPQIQQLYEQIDPGQTLRQLYGIGPVIAATIEALTGDVRRFRNARSYVSYCGLCPRKRDSGKRKRQGLPMTKSGPRLLKAYFHLAAETARHWDPEFAHAYQRFEERGKHHGVILVALASKLARRVYALLQRRATGADPRWELRNPQGRAVSRVEARELIREHYPSKSERERRRRSGGHKRADQAQEGDAGPVHSGQSNDSTSREAPRPLPDHDDPTTLAHGLRQLQRQLEATRNPGRGEPVDDLGAATARSEKDPP
jgi:transposase